MFHIMAYYEYHTLVQQKFSERDEAFLTEKPFFMFFVDSTEINHIVPPSIIPPPLVNGWMNGWMKQIYPCSVVPWTIIDKWHREGSYVPYPEDQLFELILSVKARVHPWIRLNRVIRDIPNQYITGGCSVTNMRQVCSCMLLWGGGGVLICYSPYSFNR